MKRIRGLQIIATGMAIAAVLFLFLRDGTDERQEAFDAAQLKALAAEDPWGAYLIYAKDLEQIRYCGIRFEHSCPKGFYEDKVPETLLMRALEEKNSDAFMELYSTDLNDTKYVKTKVEYAPRFLELVDSGAWERRTKVEYEPKFEEMLGTRQFGTNERKVYFVAARLLSDGNYITTDTPRAAGYLVEAWKGGSIDAPRLIARLYKATNNYANAYLWSLRCVGECRFGSNRIRETFDGYQTGLSNSDIIAIQKLANDHSVISVRPELLSKR